MVLLSTQQTQCPVGGSSFAGTFKNNCAFSSMIYKPPASAEGGSRRRESSQPAPEMKSAMAQTLYDNAAELAKDPNPDRFASAYQESMDKLATRGGSMKERLSTSKSTPSLGRDMLQFPWQDTFRRPDFLIPGNGKTSYKPLWDFNKGNITRSIEGVDGSKKWYPHPSLQRGQLLLSMPRALAYGVDPARYKTNACPFWDAPYHRFAEVAAMPESAPRTPDRAKRWFSDEAWDDPTKHAAYKVTHTTPGAHSAQQLGTTALPPL